MGYRLVLSSHFAKNESHTQYDLTVTGLATPTTGRYAFRYFVEDGGSGGSNSNYIGIDTVSVESSISTPIPEHTSTLSIVSLGLFGSFLSIQSKTKRKKEVL